MNNRKEKQEEIMYWKITPNIDPEYDVAIMPANNEADHRAALDYAKDRLEYLWDTAEENEAKSVTIELCKRCWQAKRSSI